MFFHYYSSYLLLLFSERRNSEEPQEHDGKTTLVEVSLSSLMDSLDLESVEGGSNESVPSGIGASAASTPTTWPGMSSSSSLSSAASELLPTVGNKFRVAVPAPRARTPSRSFGSSGGNSASGSRIPRRRPRTVVHDPAASTPSPGRSSSMDPKRPSRSSVLAAQIDELDDGFETDHPEAASQLKRIAALQAQIEQVDAASELRDLERDVLDAQIAHKETLLNLHRLQAYAEARHNATMARLRRKEMQVRTDLLQARVTALRYGGKDVASSILSPESLAGSSARSTLSYPVAPPQGPLSSSPTPTPPPSSSASSSVYLSTTTSSPSVSPIPIAEPFPMIPSAPSSRRTSRPSSRLKARSPVPLRTSPDFVFSYSSSEELEEAGEPAELMSMPPISPVSAGSLAERRKRPLSVSLDSPTVAIPPPLASPPFKPNKLDRRPFEVDDHDYDHDHHDHDDHDGGDDNDKQEVGEKHVLNLEDSGDDGDTDVYGRESPTKRARYTYQPQPTRRTSSHSPEPHLGVSSELVTRFTRSNSQGSVSSTISARPSQDGGLEGGLYGEEVSDSEASLDMSGELADILRECAAATERAGSWTGSDSDSPGEDDDDELFSARLSLYTTVGGSSSKSPSTAPTPTTTTPHPNSGRQRQGSMPDKPSD